MHVVIEALTTPIAQTKEMSHLVQKVRSPGFDLALEHLEPQIASQDCLARFALSLVPTRS